MTRASPLGAARRRLGLFGQGPFAVYWAGGFLSNVGTWLQAVAGSVFVYDRTGSAAAVGILNFATFLPILIFSMFGGVISDRVDRRVVVVVTHAASAIIALGLGVLSAFGAATEIHVIAAAFALQTSWAIAKPSLISMLPAIVRRSELQEAVGLNTLQFMTGQLVGPVIATFVLATAGYSWAFGLNALTFFAPILVMVYLWQRGLGAAARPAGGGVTREQRGILAFVRSQPWIAFSLLTVVMTSAATEVIRTTAPVLASERLGRPSSDAGLVIAAQSVGYILGILAFVPLGRRDLARPSAAFGLVLQACGLILGSTATDIAIATVAIAAVGMGFALCLPVVTAPLQSEVPDHMRGRVMSLHQIALLGNRPFSALAAGTIAGSFGVPTAFLAATIVAPLGLLALRGAWRGLGTAREAVPAAASPG